LINFQLGSSGVSGQWLSADKWVGCCIERGVLTRPGRMLWTRQI